MKVKDVIAELSKYDPEEIVYTADSEDGYCEVTMVYKAKHWQGDEKLVIYQ